MTAIAVVALFVITNMTAAPRASALTPPPLTFTATGQTPKDVLTMAEHTLTRSPSPTSAVRYSQSTGWYAQLAANENNEITSATIAPQITTLEWAADLSGHLRVIAGTPYWADGATNAIPARTAPTPGTVILDTTFTAGGVTAPTTNPPGESVEEMRTWLTEFGLPSGADAADLIGTINQVLSYWTLTNEQHALLLQILLDRDDITVLGMGKDRAGRPVTGIAADSHRSPGSRELLLISASTGRIIANETMRTTKAGALPAGSVTSYTLWGLPKQ
ncbi:hypothetical protein [Microbacterium sp.]|uniref:hypothetical protein n=1 Tax=Microbacterium sp. TaxID=51671 RepID=UPI001AC5D3D5|nr:hypothetical protein [Microbacterium sp.]MBN9187231.1 hypothetical protein [Microbacterium sp.]MBN9193882.1 hypothetical protein [Microbacterium sp.]